MKVQVAAVARGMDAVYTMGLNNLPAFVMGFPLEIITKEIFQ